MGTYDQGLNKYLDEKKFEHIQKVEGVESSLSHNRIWDIENNNNDSLWIATSFGLNLYDKKQNTFSHFFPAPDNPTPTGANEIRNILKTTKNEIYVAHKKAHLALTKQKDISQN